MPGRFPITLKVLVVREGLALVLRDRGSGYADLPGGRIEPGEVGPPWLPALRRELAEELGPYPVVVAEEPSLLFAHHIHATGEEALGILFLGCGDDGEIVLSDEHDGLAWVPWAALGDVDFPPTMLAAVRRALVAWAGAERST